MTLTRVCVLESSVARQPRLDKDRMLLETFLLLLVLSHNTASVLSTNQDRQQHRLGPLLSIFRWVDQIIINYQKVEITISLSILSSLDKGTFSEVPSPNVAFNVETLSSYRPKPNWYLRF